MKLASLLDPELIEVNIKATLLADVINLLLDAVAKKRESLNRSAALSAVLARETLSPTAIGRGFAIPHARTDAIDEQVIAIAVSKQGIEAKAPDRKPVHVFMLILTSTNSGGYYLQTLSALSRFARIPDVLDKLIKAENGNDVVEIFFDANVDVAKEIRVMDIISDRLITIRPDSTLKDAANLFYKHRISGLPVVEEGGVLLGEITDTDLLKFAMPNYQSLLANLAELPETEPLEELLRNEDKITVRKVMSSPMESVNPNSTITEVVALMLFKGARRVAVVDKGQLIGIISARDIIDKIVRV